MTRTKQRNDSTALSIKDVFSFLAANKKKGQAGKTKGKKGKSRLRNEFKMDIKDMIVKKRLASLNASAIMSASYAQERTPGKDIMSCELLKK